jgi:hypothetical protein
MWALVEDRYNYRFHRGEKYFDQLRAAQRILNSFVLLLISFTVCLCVYFFLARFAVWLVLFLIPFPFHNCFGKITLNFSAYLIFLEYNVKLAFVSRNGVIPIDIFCLKVTESYSKIFQLQKILILCNTALRTLPTRWSEIFVANVLCPVSSIKGTFKYASECNSALALLLCCYKGKSLRGTCWYKLFIVCA